jgi:hypothetical protein
MPIEYEGGRIVIACRVEDIDFNLLNTYGDYEELLQGKFCPVCEWELDMFGRCVFRNEPDHQHKEK